jgi:hypothetical protein
MKFLIEIDGGDARYATITPTVPTLYANRINDELILNMEALEQIGLKGACRINHVKNYCCQGLAVGSEACVQVRKRYAWDKPEVTANVPVYFYCDSGLFGSVLRWLKDRIKSV